MTKNTPLLLPDVSANRKAKKWTRKEIAGRVLWAAIARPLFALSPRPLWGLRRGILRLFGARIGRDVHVYPSVRINIPWNISLADGVAVGDRAILYALGPITVGKNSTISQGAHICAGSHDYRDPTMPLTKPPVRIGAGVWICADAFVGPGVTVGDSAILAARSVAVQDVDAALIVGGNPAKPIKTRMDFKPLK